MNGILIVDKPQDWTSHDVVAKLRGFFGVRRIGHAGTLDPMATGVLVVFVGRATRAVEFAQADSKEYIAGIKLGVTTDTQDVTGTVLCQRKSEVTREMMESAVKRFCGKIEQIPPMYSALKVNGKKLYEVARKGGVVERKPREVEIGDIDILEDTGDGFLLRVQCSKGTYIRTLCHDIGEYLGTGGVMSYLRRTKSGAFSLEDAVTLAQIQQETENRERFLTPVDRLFFEYPRLDIDTDSEWRYRCGQKISIPGVPEGMYRVYSGKTGEFLALGEICQIVGEPILCLVKSFYTT